MSFQPVVISGYNKGLEKNKKPFLLIDSAFQELTNALVWRDRVKKREGIKLVGRLRRLFPQASIGNSSPSPWNISTIYTTYTPAITKETNAQISPKTLVITIQAGPDIVFTDQGDGTLTSPTAGNTGRINYITGDVDLTHTAGAGVASVAQFAYFPFLPVMGIRTRELTAINVESAVFFDTKYAYTHNGDDFVEMGSSVAVTWTGSDAEFFWSANYRGSTADLRLFFVTNFNITDPIRYHNGSTWASLIPITGNTGLGTETSIFQTKIIIPYYGRLIFLNTWEGTTSAGSGSAVNFFNRCRFSQIGDPTQSDAWTSDIFGKGGFIDAPTNEAIVSATFYKNTLIVFFEKTTWSLDYVGNYGLPFIWNRISSDLGSESTFSSILFDEGVFGVGNRAIVAASSNDVQRIDLQIPDEVFNFHNKEDGKERVHGIRDFQKEIVYWCYSDGKIRRKYPNRVLIYNYRNNTWAKFRDNVTAFGQFTSPIGVSWDTPTSWDSDVQWDTIYQNEFPTIVCGNQQGYVHFYQYPADFEPTADSNIDAIENESLSVTNLTRGAASPVRLTVIDHNLETDDIVYMNSVAFVDQDTNLPITSSLNDSFYQILWIDADTVDLYYWNFSTGQYLMASEDNLSYTPAIGTGTYFGAGQLTLFPKLSIRTKDFNPFQNQGKQLMINYVDFQTDATVNAAVSVKLSINSSVGIVGNVIVGNKETETSLVDSGIISAATKDNPCKITAPDHSLKTGDEITITYVKGMTELNNIDYVITFVDLNNFTLDGIDASAFTTYISSGRWTKKTLQYYYVPGSNYAWHRFYASVYGQYVSLQITYDDPLMNTQEIHQQKFEMNAMQVWTRPAGRLP